VKFESKELLRRLGSGESIAQVCEAAGIDRQAFDAWWQGECRRRLSPTKGERSLKGPRRAVSITRDERGVPHVFADNHDDLFFGFGYAVAQDRLFQLHYLSAKARGRLAEILGKEAIESDKLYRTLDLDGIARREAEAMPAATRRLVDAYVAGVQAHQAWCRDNQCWPIEYDLLGIDATPWDIVDSLAIIGEFRWYLTGRFPVIAIPEIVRRAVGDGPLYRNFLLGEQDEEAILFPGEYPTQPRWTGDPGGTLGGESGGSNNWVLAGSRTASGKPLLASDPHIPFYAVSIWHEVHLRGGSFNVAGVALAGMPSVMIGRNENVAWGITNNICSQRDLYLEKTSPEHPGCFLFDGRWEPGREREETIRVRGGEAVKINIRSSRNGPIVDDVLPAAIKDTGPVSVRWLGRDACGWVQAMIDMNRARNLDTVRAAAKPWSVPTFNLVIADSEGRIAYQSVGRIPLRKLRERAYRPGWDPAHQWQGCIPFEHMPHLVDPKRSYAVTANNRVAPDDFHYPLAGCWATGYRHRRIREAIEARPKWSRDDCRQFQMDTFSGRAAACVPPLVRELSDDADPSIQHMLASMKKWDFRIDAESKAALLFELFFWHWCHEVTAERLPAPQFGFATATAGGLAVRLLEGDSQGWFQKKSRKEAIRSAFVAAIDTLVRKLGSSDESVHTWGNLHRLCQKHYLSDRGELGSLLDLSGVPTGGDGTTVNAGTFDTQYRNSLGAGFRMVVELDDPRRGYWGIEVASASGQPGSPHYSDQIEPWAAGRLFYVPLTGDIAGTRFTLSPT
jgi:penicillin amidase